MFERLYPKIVSLLGAAGLALALAYFAGIYLAFQPDWQSWAEFFVQAALPLMALPCVLLLLHLYLRTDLGRWYVRRGRIDEAIAYCEARLDHNLLRGRKEALTHRVNLARAYIYRAQYDAAAEVLTAGFSMPEKGAQAVEICRWRMEVALRLDDLVRCRKAWEDGASIPRPSGDRAYLRACRAELAARENDRGAFGEAIDEALWDGADNGRVKLAHILGLVRFGASSAELDEALALLEEIEAPTLVDVPYREGELAALRAELLHRLGRPDAAQRALAEAGDALADARSEYEIRRVRERISAASSTRSNQTEDASWKP